MTTLTKPSLLPEMPSFFSDLWDENVWSARFGNQYKLPAVNVIDNAGDFTVELAVPGMKKKDFKIDVDGDMLNVYSEHQEESKEDKKHYTRREFSYNVFSRSFNLPESVDAGKIEATYTDGILKLTLPKKEESKKISKRHVTVN